MMRVGLYRPVHVKTLRSQKLRMLLTHRKLLQSKAIAINNDLRGTLRNFGLKVGMVGKVKFETRIKELLENLPDLAELGECSLVALAVAARAGEDGDAAGGVGAHFRQLVEADAGTKLARHHRGCHGAGVDIGADADTAQLAAFRGLLPSLLAWLSVKKISLRSAVHLTGRPNLPASQARAPARHRASPWSRSRRKYIRASGSTGAGPLTS